MKEFFSNAWVISIISGILVFLITNAIIMMQDKSHQKKQIYEANTMLLNHLRGYVVENGLPPSEIINAVKASVAREYNVKYNELLTTQSLCEELVKDIIGNIYISNDGQKKYIDMLYNYLKQNDGLKDDDKMSLNNSSQSYMYIKNIAAIAGFISSIITILSFLIFN